VHHHAFRGLGGVFLYAGRLLRRVLGSSEFSRERERRRAWTRRVRGGVRAGMGGVFHRGVPRAGGVAGQHSCACGPLNCLLLRLLSWLLLAVLDVVSGAQSWV
jgi:hypothetical protein